MSDTMPIMDDELSRKIKEVIGGLEAIPIDPKIRDFFALKGHPISDPWQSLSLDNLPEWLASQSRRAPLPIYELAEKAPPLDLEPYLFAERADAFAPNVQRRADSGLWTVKLPRDSRRQFEAAQASLLIRVHSAAERLDSRKLMPAARPSSSVIMSIERSSLPEHDLPVLGPGGCLAVYLVAEAFEVDVVFRKRERSITSQWRSPSDITSAIRRQISAVGMDGEISKIKGSLGYFELSKYELQLLLRPAFVFHVELLDPSSRKPAWRSTIVEPATSADGIALSEGLGSWVG